MFNAEKTKVVVVGSCNADLTVYAERVPAAGETILGSALVIGPGGKGANQATAAARAGGSAAMIGRVGEDFLAGVVKENFAREGVDVAHMASRADAGTGTATIIVEQSGENRIVVVPGANARLSPSDVSAAEELIASADVLLVQLEIPPETAVAALRLAKEHGVTTVLNPAPPIPLPNEAFALADYITPNETEAAAYTGISQTDDSSAEAAGRALLARGAGCAIITLGRRGALLVRRGECARIPAPKVKTVDTTAAGDTFCGAFAVAVGEGLAPREAVSFACRAASIAVSRRGAAVSAPTRAEIDAFK